jgi:hypothetical protein
MITFLVKSKGTPNGVPSATPPGAQTYVGHRQSHESIKRRKDFYFSHKHQVVYGEGPVRKVREHKVAEDVLDECVQRCDQPLIEGTGYNGPRKMR